MITGLLISLFVFFYNQPKQPAVLSPVLAQAAPSPTSTPTPTVTPTATPWPTSTPVPTNTPVPLPQSNFESLFDQYSNQYGVSKDQLKKIATCESGINPSSNSGPYAGMFQFAEQTWTSTRSAMGLDTNPELRYSAEEAIKTAAYKISQGGASAWANCI